MTPNFGAAVNALLQICCNIVAGMPNPRIFVENIVALLGAMTVHWKRKFVTAYRRN